MPNVAPTGPIVHPSHLALYLTGWPISCTPQVKTGLAAALISKYQYAAVVMSDTDVAWLRDPHELLQQQPDADIMVSTDCLSYEAEVAGTPNINRCGHIPGSWHSYAFNTGVVIVRNTPRAIRVGLRAANGRMGVVRCVCTLPCISHMQRTKRQPCCISGMSKACIACSVVAFHIQHVAIVV
jgi:hypothetical protein